MAQQVINVGAAPNDGTGDPLRTAMTKANANFSELYTRAVLQRVYFTTTTESQTTAAIFQPSALTANITPLSVSNLIRVSAIGGLKSDGSSAAAIARLHRSSGAVPFGNTAVVYPQDIYVTGLAFFGIDSPATTSSVTYDVRFCATTGGTNVRFLPSAVGVQVGVLLLEEIQG